jgi:hypothetical protein
MGLRCSLTAFRGGCFIDAANGRIDSSFGARCFLSAVLTSEYANATQQNNAAIVPNLKD